MLDAVPDLRPALNAASEAELVEIFRAFDLTITYDEQFLAGLPADVDPCSENGEFHTFVHAGPIFAEPILCATGEVVERERFVSAI